MGIQKKRLILLLSISLIPLIILVIFNHFATRELARELATQSRQALSEKAQQQLGFMTRGYSRLLQREQKIVELLLKLQTHKAEQLLASTPSNTSRLYFDTDLDTGIDTPADYAPSVEHQHVNEQGLPEPMSISYSQHVNRVSLNVEKQDVMADAQRLSGLSEVFQSANREHNDLLFWQYISLENGLLITYPAHGGYPNDFEPRQRKWYTAQKQARQLRWGLPIVDASSQQITMSVSLPLYYPDQRFAGVSAIDVPITRVLSRYQPPGDWLQGGRMYMTQLQKDEDSSDDYIHVLAKPFYAETGQSWKTVVQQEVLSSSDKQTLATIMHDMAHKTSNIRQLPHEGEDALWAYRRFNELNTYLIFIIPYEKIVSFATTAENYVLSETRRQSLSTIPFILLVMLAAILIAIISARKMTNPIRQLCLAAEQVARGNFNARVNIISGDEMQTLGKDFNLMVPQLAERLKIKDSLLLAREVQQKLLPEAAPNSDQLDIAGISHYADETGGDYYDFLDLNDLDKGCYGIAIGDVSGHGVSSALMMTTVRTLLHNFARQEHTTDRVMQDINQHVSCNTHAGQFMTLFYLMFDTQQRKLWWTSAGHDPAISYTPQENSFSELHAEDIPLGIDPDWQYRGMQRSHWVKGEIIVLGTDGIWETRNPQNEQFGKTRLKQIIHDNCKHSADDICTRIVEQVEEFRATSPQHDDLTIVVIKTLQ